MLKTSRKSLLIVAVFLFLSGNTLTAYALYAQSNVVHVDMQYSAVLSSSVADSTITLNAAVTCNSAPVRAGINVDFYYSLDNGELTYFATGSTDAAGVAQAIYSNTKRRI